MFQAIFGKVDEFVWWDMDRTQTEANTQFISKEFQGGLSVFVVGLSFVASDHQEMNGQVEVT